MSQPEPFRHATTNDPASDFCDNFSNDPFNGRRNQRPQLSQLCRDGLNNMLRRSPANRWDTSQIQTWAGQLVKPAGFRGNYRDVDDESSRRSSCSYRGEDDRGPEDGALNTGFGSDGAPRFVAGPVAVPMGGSRAGGLIATATAIAAVELP